jgi:hypothetical protein
MNFAKKVNGVIEPENYIHLVNQWSEEWFISIWQNGVKAPKIYANSQAQPPMQEAENAISVYI